MFIYVGALAVVFLAQSGVTAFIQAPAKRASTRATWGGAPKNDAAKHLAGPVGWDLGDDALGWAASQDDGGGSPPDDTNLSDGDDVALARRRRGDRALLEGAWGREAVRHKFRGQTREDLVCPAARALALKWGKACAVAYPALTVLAVCSIGPEGVT
mmetsp:Transcript_2140/g.4945  ORF Transcript_2140/g.4945 Transcript_2140/m.4945 type:complete len:157 (-) Transcript_2140:91-561(-)